MQCDWLVLAKWGSAAPALTHHHIAYGDLATWFGSVGVVGALLAALYQINTERKRRHSDEQAERLRQRRQQAERVSGWPGRESLPTTPLILLNRSDEPVYEVVANLVMVQGAGPRRGEDNPAGRFRKVMGILPPGTWRVDVAGGWAGMSKRPGVEVAFTDRSGIHWIRRADGALEEIRKPAIDHYSLGRPQALEIPAPYSASPPAG
jgi:hypothetical protein